MENPFNLYLDEIDFLIPICNADLSNECQAYYFIIQLMKTYSKSRNKADQNKITNALLLINSYLIRKIESQYEQISSSIDNCANTTIQSLFTSIL